MPPAPISPDVSSPSSSSTSGDSPPMAQPNAPSPVTTYVAPDRSETSVQPTAPATSYVAPDRSSQQPPKENAAPLAQPNTPPVATTYVAPDREAKPSPLPEQKAPQGYVSPTKGDTAIQQLYNAPALPETITRDFPQERFSLASGIADENIDRQIVDGATKMATSPQIDKQIGNEQAPAPEKMIQQIGDTKNPIQLLAQEQISPETAVRAVDYQHAKWNQMDPWQHLQQYMIMGGTSVADAAKSLAEGVIHVPELAAHSVLLGRDALEVALMHDVNPETGLPQNAKFGFAPYPVVEPKMPDFDIPQAWQFRQGMPGEQTDFSPQLPALSKPGSLEYEAEHQRAIKTLVSAGNDFLSAVKGFMPMQRTQGDQVIDKWLGIESPPDGATRRSISDLYGMQLPDKWENLSQQQKAAAVQAQAAKLQGEGRNLVGDSDQAKALIQYLTGNRALTPLEQQSLAPVDPKTVEAGSFLAQSLALGGLPELPGANALIDKLSGLGLTGSRVATYGPSMFLKGISSAAKNEAAMGTVGAIGGLGAMAAATAKGGPLGLIFSLGAPVRGAKWGMSLARNGLLSKAIELSAYPFNAADRVLATAAEEASAGRPFFKDSVAGLPLDYVPQGLRNAFQSATPEPSMAQAGPFTRLAAGTLAGTARGAVTGGLLAVPGFHPEEPTAPEQFGQSVGSMAALGGWAAVPRAGILGFNAPFDHVYIPKYDNILSWRQGAGAENAPYRRYNTVPGLDDQVEKIWDIFSPRQQNGINNLRELMQGKAEIYPLDHGSFVNAMASSVAQRLAPLQDALEQAATKEMEARKDPEYQNSPDFQKNQDALADLFHQRQSLFNEAYGALTARGFYLHSGIGKGQVPQAFVRADALDSALNHEGGGHGLWEIMKSNPKYADAAANFMSAAKRTTNLDKFTSDYVSKLTNGGITDATYDELPNEIGGQGSSLMPRETAAKPTETIPPIDFTTLGQERVGPPAPEPTPPPVARGELKPADFSNLRPSGRIEISKAQIDDEIAAEHIAGLLDGERVSNFTKNPTLQRHLILGIGSALENILGIPVTSTYARSEFDGLNRGIKSALVLDQAIRAISKDPNTIRPWIPAELQAALTGKLGKGRGGAPPAPGPVTPKPEPQAAGQVQPATQTGAEVPPPTEAEAAGKPQEQKGAQLGPEEIKRLKKQGYSDEVIARMQQQGEVRQPSGGATFREGTQELSPADRAKRNLVDNQGWTKEDADKYVPQDARSVLEAIQKAYDARGVPKVSGTHATITPPPVAGTQAPPAPQPNIQTPPAQAAPQSGGVYSPLPPVPGQPAPPPPAPVTPQATEPSEAQHPQVQPEVKEPQVSAPETVVPQEKVLHRIAREGGARPETAGLQKHLRQKEGLNPSQAHEVANKPPEQWQAAPPLTHTGRGNIGAFGYAGDSGWDTNSGRGIGAFPHTSKPGSMIEGYSAGLTDAGARKRGVLPGQEFVAEDGKTYRYDDRAPDEAFGHKVPDDYVDVYLPHHAPDAGVSAERIAANQAIMDAAGIGSAGRRGPLSPGEAIVQKSTGTQPEAPYMAPPHRGETAERKPEAEQERPGKLSDADIQEAFEVARSEMPKASEDEVTQRVSRDIGLRHSKDLGYDENGMPFQPITDTRVTYRGDRGVWEGANFVGCYSSDTEILTRRGWVLFHELRDMDQVATRNCADTQFEWQHPSQFLSQEYSGTMVHFRSRSLDILVTPDHRMLVLPQGSRTERITSAESANAFTRVPVTSGWKGERISIKSFSMPNESVIPDRDNKSGKTGVRWDPVREKWEARIHKKGSPGSRYIGWYDTFHDALSARVDAENKLGHPRFKEIDISGDDFCALAGAYLAEGNVHKPNGRILGIQISQSAGSKAFKTYKELMERIQGFSGYYSEAFNIRRRAMGVYFNQFGKSHEKFIPDEIMNASPDQIRIFLHYYILGDGHLKRNRISASGKGRREEHSISSSTVSKRLADQLQELWQKIGKTASVTRSTGRDRIFPGKTHVSKCLPRYTVQVSSTEYRRFSKQGVNYSGMVYCVTVPNGIVYIRRNGKPCWCGNSDPVHQWLLKDITPHEQNVLNTVEAAIRGKNELYVTYGSAPEIQGQHPGPVTGKERAEAQLESQSAARAKGLEDIQLAGKTVVPSYVGAVVGSKGEPNHITWGGASPDKISSNADMISRQMGKASPYRSGPLMTPGERDAAEEDMRGYLWNTSNGSKGSGEGQMQGPVSAMIPIPAPGFHPYPLGQEKSNFWNLAVSGNGAKLSERPGAIKSASALDLARLNEGYAKQGYTNPLAHQIDMSSPIFPVLNKKTGKPTGKVETWTQHELHSGFEKLRADLTHEFHPSTETLPEKIHVGHETVAKALAEKGYPVAATVKAGFMPGKGREERIASGKQRLIAATPEDFIRARDKGTKYNRFLSPLQPSDLSEHTLLVNQDHTIGLAIDPHGDIQNVFNNGGPKGAVSHAMVDAINRGATTLDAYDGFLPQYYRQFGFHETGRMKFNPEFAHGFGPEDGTPDVVFMSWKGYPEGGADAAAYRAATRKEWIKNEPATNYETDWDTAKAASREESIKPGGEGDNRGPRETSGQETLTPGVEPSAQAGEGDRGTLTLGDRLKKNEHLRAQLEKQQARLDTTKPEEDKQWDQLASKIHELEDEHRSISEQVEPKTESEGVAWMPGKPEQKEEVGRQEIRAGSQGQPIRLTGNYSQETAPGETIRFQEPLSSAFMPMAGERASGYPEAEREGRTFPGVYGKPRFERAIGIQAKAAFLPPKKMPDEMREALTPEARKQFIAQMQDRAREILEAKGVRHPWSNEAAGEKIPEGSKMKVEELADFFEKHTKPQDLSDPKVRGKMADSVMHDVLTEVAHNGNAVDWYDVTPDAAMKYVAQHIDPSILESPENTLHYKIAQAVTSNGQNVYDNAETGLHAYQFWRDHGRLPETSKDMTTNIWDPKKQAFKKLGGTKVNNMLDSFRTVNQLSKDIGTEGLAQLLDKEMTAKELEQKGFKISGESPETPLRGSMMFGPKLGAFYANLNKHFEHLVMDLWFSRHMNRMTGNIFGFTDPGFRGQVRKLKDHLDQGLISPENKEDLLREADQVLSQPENSITRNDAIRNYPAIDQYVKDTYKTFEKSSNEKFGSFADKTPWNKNSRNMFVSIHKGMDAPRGPVERKLYRDIISRVQNKLHKAGIDMSIAGIQATAWYNIQRLYDKAGALGKGSDTSDYLDAAYALHKYKQEPKPQPESATPISPKVHKKNIPSVPVRKAA